MTKKNECKGRTVCNLLYKMFEEEHDEKFLVRIQRKIHNMFTENSKHWKVFVYEYVPGNAELLYCISDSWLNFCFTEVCGHLTPVKGCQILGVEIVYDPKKMWDYAAGHMSIPPKCLKPECRKIKPEGRVAWKISRNAKFFAISYYPTYIEEFTPVHITVPGLPTEMAITSPRIASLFFLIARENGLSTSIPKLTSFLPVDLLNCRGQKGFRAACKFYDWLYKYVNNQLKGYGRLI